MVSKNKKTVWLSSKRKERRLIVWFIWSFIIIGSLVSFHFGIWPLSLHLIMSGIIITIAFKKITQHQYAKEEFKIDPEHYEPDVD